MKITKWIAVTSAALAAAGMAALAVAPLSPPPAGEEPLNKKGGKAAGDALKTDSAKFFYSLGLQVGSFSRGLRTEVDRDAFKRGLEDGLKNNKPLLSPQKAFEIRQSFIRKLVKEHTAKNLKEGAAFLAANKKRKGVVTTASGLQYEMLKKGKGQRPRAVDMVVVHYRGTLLDGTEFDNSYKRGEPAIFKVGGVIRGWQEALQLMKVGSKYKLFIPSGLAYGAQGRAPGSGIYPHAALIFEVELMSIKKPVKGSGSKVFE